MHSWALGVSMRLQPRWWRISGPLYSGLPQIRPQIFSHFKVSSGRSLYFLLLRVFSFINFWYNTSNSLSSTDFLTFYLM